MTVDEFFDYVEQAVGSYPTWRPGQCLFNHLYYVRPDLADQIRATDKDPFFSDTKHDSRYVKAAEFIRENW